MINVGGYSRSSLLRPEDIDLNAGREAIQSLIQATLRHGQPITWFRYSGAHTDITYNLADQYRDKLSRKDQEEFSQEQFHAEMEKRTLGLGVDLQMKPSEDPMYGSVHVLGEIGLQSRYRRPDGVMTGYLLGTISLRNDGPDEANYEDTEQTFLDIELHSEGQVLMDGHIDTRRNTQTGFWNDLHFDEITPLAPNIMHVIMAEPLGKRQVTALTGYILERMPE